MTPIRTPVSPDNDGAGTRRQRASHRSRQSTCLPARVDAPPDRTIEARGAIAKMTAGPGVTIIGVPPSRMCAKKPRKLRIGT